MRFGLWRAILNLVLEVRANRAWLGFYFGLRVEGFRNKYWILSCHPSQSFMEPFFSTADSLVAGNKEFQSFFRELTYVVHLLLELGGASNLSEASNPVPTPDLATLRLY